MHNSAVFAVLLKGASGRLLQAWGCAALGGAASFDSTSNLLEARFGLGLAGEGVRAPQPSVTKMNPGPCADTMARRAQSFFEHLHGRIPTSTSARHQISLALRPEEGVQSPLLRICARSRPWGSHARDIDALAAQLLFDEQQELVVEN